MPFRFKAIPAVFTIFLAAASLGQLSAQTPADAPSVAAAPAAVLPSAILRPALSEVQSTTAALNVPKWNISGAVRKSTQEDVDSIQRDLGGTLPSLLAQADAAPGSVPPSFAVYRNLDALYDVLLRVSQTADLAAPSKEAVSVASSLRRLEAARKEMGDAILNTSQRHEARIVALESAARTATAAPSARKNETIIDDGPEKAHARRTRRKTVHKKPPPKAASGHST